MQSVLVKYILSLSPSLNSHYYCSSAGSQVLSLETLKWAFLLMSSGLICHMINHTHTHTHARTHTHQSCSLEQPSPYSFSDFPIDIRVKSTYLSVPFKDYYNIVSLKFSCLRASPPSFIHGTDDSCSLFFEFIYWFFRYPVSCLCFFICLE